MNESKKAFDSTVCFSFYGSWARAIERLETEKDKDSLAYTLYKAIADYNLYGKEPDFDRPEKLEQMALETVWETISNEADNSIERRKRGFAQEQPTELQQAIINEAIVRPDASITSIAQALRTGKGNVSKTMKKYSDLIEKGRAKREEKKIILKYTEADDQRKPEDTPYCMLSDEQCTEAEYDNDLPF